MSPALVVALHVLGLFVGAFIGWRLNQVRAYKLGYQHAIQDAPGVYRNAARLIKARSTDMKSYAPEEK